MPGQQPDLTTTDPVEDREVLDPHQTRSWDPNIVLRVLGVAAAGVMTVIGLIAVAQISWSADGFDAPAVDAAGMTFTPEVAVAVAVTGLIALVAAASADRASKLVVGALLVCAGIVILATDTIAEPDWAFENAQGWLAIAVGATLIVVAVLMQVVWASSHRTVRQRRPMAY
jgi:peptidoglycan/LPS O-acetylase OafA/YrhL